MQKKEKGPIMWKTAACCAVCAVGIYAMLQLLNAALVAREMVGEQQTGVLVWAAAAISTFIGVGTMGRKCRTGRMILGAGCVAGWLLTVLMGDDIFWQGAGGISGTAVPRNGSGAGRRCSGECATGAWKREAKEKVGQRKRERLHNAEGLAGDKGKNKKRLL